ncbi:MULTISPECIES: PqqD family protein [Halomonadaceae]|uniref:PqqD family protein n=1 Tax=Halomonadaceae TaxID=28256 RepID=UPI0015985227|nr:MULTISPECIES: PqqD family protein [Halomonas]QJQ94016.1 PqqD family protein [Halomonas sp. PA5]
MNKDISMGDIIVKIESQISASVDEEEAVLHTKAGVYYSLNSVGRYIWHYIETPKSVGEIVDHVISAYDVDMETCIASVKGLLVSLSEYDLITIRKA